MERKPQTRAARRAPRPLLQEPGALLGAHAQRWHVARLGRRGTSGPLLASTEGAPRDFRTVPPRLPSLSWRRGALRGRPSSARCAEARAWRGSRRRGPLAELPAPVCTSPGAPLSTRPVMAPCQARPRGRGRHLTQDPPTAAAFSSQAQRRAPSPRLQTVPIA